MELRFDAPKLRIRRLGASVILEPISRDGRLGAPRPGRGRSRSPTGLPVVVYHALFFGAFKGQRPAENLDVVDRLEFEAVEFTKEDAREAGELWAILAVAGSPIGPYDVLIAAQARRRGLTLITANTAEFARIEGLRYENWLDA